MATVQTGIERFIEAPQRWISEDRLGLLCNPASVDRRYCHARMRIHQALPQRLQALYSPQHGFFGEKQDNMVESDDMLDPVLQIPVFSLYGKTRVPTSRMLDPIDVLLVDLQDVGTRVYTFSYTLSYCLEAAKKKGIRVVVLDRPNPINGVDVEGNCLSSDGISFVGRYPIPMRHGLTLGELAILFNEYFEIGCNLQVVPMRGWERSMLFPDTGLPWVAPSPNMPTPASALVYPGQVLWEGTNVSEGRGTTQPFELFGAPYFDTEKILKHLPLNSLEGMVLRTVLFEPTSNKWQGTPCNGFQLHITDPAGYRPYRTTLNILKTVMLQHAAKFAWKLPPYEYEFERLPIDLIIGDQSIRRRLESLESIDAIEASWQDDLNRFKTTSRKFHLYR